MNLGGLYIHFPFCTQKCIYCDFYSLPNTNKLTSEKFVEFLCKEIELTAKTTKISWNINTLFIGGGTPSLLSLKQLEKIYTTLDNAFNLSELEEFTLESNPGEFSLRKIQDFKSFGINRLSIGFQSLHNKTLRTLSRWHTKKDCIETYKNARQANFENINIDMIFNVPGQTLNQWKKDLKSITNLSPEHLSIYSLIIEKGTVLYDQILSKKIKPNTANLNTEMYFYALKSLEERGYSQYEISSYSRKHKQCQHNLHYWRRSPYLAFGPSAHSFYNKTRYWNIRDFDNYTQKLKSNKLPIENTETLQNENIFNEIIINGLKTSRGLDTEYIKKRFSKTTFKRLCKKIAVWNKYLNHNKDTIYLKKEGHLMIDEIALDLMNSFQA